MRHIFALGTVLLLALAPVGAVAKPGTPNGNANGNNHNGGNGNDHDCPPGLAWRSPACVPPGLARQGVTTEDWIGRDTTDYHEGDYLDPEDFIWINDHDHYGLPVLSDGQRYAVIDGTLVRLDGESYEILQLIRAFAAVVD